MMEPHPSPSDTRTQILNAAARLMASFGLKGTTTRAIAREAGVNEVTIFRLFGTKDTLFNAIIESLFPPADDQAPLRQLLAPGWTTQAELQDLLQRFGLAFHDHFLEKNRAILRILIKSGQTIPHGERILNARAAMLRDLLAAALDPDPGRFRDEAGLFLSGLIGCFILHDPAGGSLVEPRAAVAILAATLSPRVVGPTGVTRRLVD